MNKWRVKCCGFLILLLSFAGIVYSCRAALSHSYYYRAKYAMPGAGCEAILSCCESAKNLYPANYYLYVAAGECAYGWFLSVSDKNYLEASRQWCDAGLALNPYRMQLRKLKACLISETSPAEAVDSWEKFVDWQYWHHQNHLFLVELCSKAGQYEKAMQALNLLKESGFYQQAKDIFSAAWKKETDFPSDILRSSAR